MKQTRIINWKNLDEVAHLSGIDKHELSDAYSNSLLTGSGFLTVEYDDEGKTPARMFEDDESETP